MIRKIAAWMITKRFIVIGMVGVVSLFFVWKITKLEVKTVFDDLLPQHHPFIKIHNKYVDLLGDPLKVILMLRVKDGDIYNSVTLEKVKRINDDLDLIPGVNHNQIYSIGSRKIKKLTVTSDAILTEDFMKEVPSSGEEVEGFKYMLRNHRGVYGVWVSPDETSVLFTAGFIGDLVEYSVLFREVNKIIAKETDENHMLYATGEPMLTGWVYHYRTQTYQILGVTLLALFLLLYLYFRNLPGVLVPLICTVLGGVWGLGFYGLMGYNVEPLTLVIPLLISARALSHSVQITERYFECYEEKKEVKPACIEAAASILPPGLLGIATDALGIFLIAVAPLPIMQKLAFSAAFWAFSLVFVVLILSPVLLSFFKPPKNISDIVDTATGWEQRILGQIAKAGFGRAGVITFIVGIFLFIITGWLSSQVDIGDINPGTPILWQNSTYNLANKMINEKFPGTDELYVIVEGKGEGAIHDPAFLKTLNDFQRYMEKDPSVTGSLSWSDLLPTIRRAVLEGNPKREILSSDSVENAQLIYTLKGNSAPEDFDRFGTRPGDMANVTIWYGDHMGETLRRAIATVENFIKENQEQLAKSNLKFQLASGNVGILAAANEVVKDSQFLNFALVMGITFLLCSITYRSMVAALLLLIPLNLANLITLSVMKLMGIGLNINTLPIVSVGVGVGIDYGIYLLTRICEETQIANGCSFSVVNTAIRTTGKAIFFTATTMVFGVIFWYFLSSLRFQAEMGLLLAIIMFMNMVGALILLPALIYVFKPKFLREAKVLVKA